MQATAVVFESPRHLALNECRLDSPGNADLVVETEWSGISTGTERLIWQGTMPDFPGMGYPLVPGYESVGRVVEAGPQADARVGDSVFVPGAKCFGDVRALFGGAASRLVVPSARAVKISSDLRERGVLIALAATAYHALSNTASEPPELIVGHGVLGRLLARVALAKGFDAPVVWERDSKRAGGMEGYSVIEPDADPRRDYRSIIDVSGDSGLLDTLIGRLSKGGEVVLAGFYDQPLNFSFAPAFMREATIKVAAEWRPGDLADVTSLVENGRLSLDGLITHHCDASDAAHAYETAFNDPGCLKMVLDWRSAS